MIRGSIFIILMLCLCLPALPALPALAGVGIAVGPSTINLDNALRGTDYEVSVSVLNGGDDISDFEFYAHGEAAAWMSLSYKGEPSGRVTVDSGAHATIQVKVSIPGDAANGKYTASIIFASAPPAQSTGQTVSVSASADINITVTGTQAISGTVNGISTENTELGMPLVMRVYFLNTGNVAVAPLIDVTINRNGQKVDSFNKSDTSMKPSQGDYINVQWNTSQHEPGDYTAKVNVMLEGIQIYSQELPFKILALGSLTRSGELQDISVAGTLKQGKIAKINGAFANTGDVNVMAKLIGEVYYNGSLVQTLEGDEVLVEKGIPATLSAYFTPQENGKHTIKAQVDFGGKKTSIKEITVNIGAGAVQTNSRSVNGNSPNLLYLIGGGIAILIIAAVVLFAIKKSRRTA